VRLNVSGGLVGVLIVVLPVRTGGAGKKRSRSRSFSSTTHRRPFHRDWFISTFTQWGIRTHILCAHRLF